MQVYGVREVAFRLRELLASDRLLQDIWIAGECSNVSRPASGHVYFTLKDQAAQLRAVFFANPRAKTARLIENGAAILAHGRVTLYETRGDLQLLVDYVTPEGAGALQAEFERLKDELNAEGLFDPSRKRTLPSMPQRIGVITSPSGAVFHDISTVLRRRWPLAEIVLAPSPMQGPEAVPGVVNALAQLNGEPDVDVAIIARGGGSLEELWAFNDVAVARAIFASSIPIVSAIGHETDVTIADYVADVRAPTPSAAAELVSPDASLLGAGIQLTQRTLEAALDRRIAATRSILVQRRAVIERQLPDLPRVRQLVDSLVRRAAGSAELRHRDESHRVGGCIWRLKSLSPYSTLERGYAIVTRDHAVVSSVRDVQSGTPLEVRLKDGSFSAVASGKSTASKRTSRRRTAPEAQPSLFTMPEDRV